MDLPDHIHEEILRLSAAGEEALEADDREAARVAFQRALDLLPEPRHEWEAFTWLATALGDVHWLGDEYIEARNCFMDASIGPDGYANAFVNMRLGQCCFELGDRARAEELLLRAYLLDQERVFDGEDPKYLRSIQKNLR